MQDRGAGRASLVRYVWSIRSLWLVSFHHTDETNQINQIDQINKTDASRNVTGENVNGATK